MNDKSLITVRQIVWVGACFLLALATAIPTTNAQGQILTVGTDCQYADLQTAVDNAASGDTIHIEAATFSEVSLAISGLSLDIQGGFLPGCTVQTGNPTVLSGNNNGNQSVVTIDAGAGQLVNLANLQLRDGGGPQGGGLRIAGGYTVTLSRVDVFDNNANEGGGVYVSDSTLTIKNTSQIHDNTAINAGGGLLAADESQIFLHIGTGIHHNEAIDGGGVALVSGSRLEGQGTSIAHNMAAQLGGGIYNEEGIIQLTGSNPHTTVSRNTAQDGGGIYDRSGAVLTLVSGPSPEQLLINNNTALGVGGGLYLTNSTSPDVRGNVQIGFNNASRAGGFYQEGGDGRFHGNRAGRPRITNNIATIQNGGGARLSLVDDSSPLLSGPFFDLVEITGNRATGNIGQGGGVFAHQSTLSMNAVAFKNNHTTFSGGGLFVNMSTVNITGLSSRSCDQSDLPANQYCTVFSGNEAQEDGGGGGALFIDDQSTASLSHTAMMNNIAVNIGAAIWTWGDTTIFNSRITDNGGPTIVAIDAGETYLGSSTVANNDGTAVSLVGALDLENTIIWGNAEGILGSGQLSHNGCNISQNGVGGAIVDPQFITNAQGTYHLGNNSPATDACATGPDSDLDGNDRPQGDSFDMGAFERPIKVTETSILFMSLAIR